MKSALTITRLQDLPAPTRPTRVAEVEEIFFESSGTKSFVDEDERAKFRERWLGRYLDHDPGDVWLAIGPDGRAVAYLVGARDDPAQATRFADIAYFAALAPLTARYPAHLHVNCAPGWRGQGIGTGLVEAFLASLVRAGVSGVHVVTGKGARNVAFYEARDFRVLAEGGPPRPIVFLARDLAPRT